MQIIKRTLKVWSNRCLSAYIHVLHSERHVDTLGGKLTSFRRMKSSCGSSSGDASSLSAALGWPAKSKRSRSKCGDRGDAPSADCRMTSFWKAISSSARVAWCSRSSGLAALRSRLSSWRSSVTSGGGGDTGKGGGCKATTVDNISAHFNAHVMGSFSTNV